MSAIGARSLAESLFLYHKSAAPFLVGAPLELCLASAVADQSLPVSGLSLAQTNLGLFQVQVSQTILFKSLHRTLLALKELALLVHTAHPSGLVLQSLHFKQLHNQCITARTGNSQGNLTRACFISMPWIACSRSAAICE